jgi:high affinity choline transporter 7
MRRVVRLSILALGAMAALLALRVQSVQKLWFFTSDLVFVLLFPQLVYALFDPRANRTGSICAFVVGLVLRLGGGEPILAIPQFIPYTDICAAILPGERGDWLEGATPSTLFPVRTVAAAAGLVLFPLVSRLTARWDPPCPIPQPARDL